MTTREPTDYFAPRMTPRLNDSDRERLDALHAELAGFRPRNVGSPCNQVFDYSELFRFLEFSLNNVGDPFGGTNYRLNTMEFEREVVTEFATVNEKDFRNFGFQRVWNPLGKP